MNLEFLLKNIGNGNNNFIPSANSIIITDRIPGAWFVQFKEGGHAPMFQYPERLSLVLNKFLISIQ